LLSST